MSETAAKKDLLKLQRAIVDGLEDIKAQDIRVFNTEHLSPLFERVVVASGTSNRQTKALAASVRDKLRDAGFGKPRIEGEENGEWIIVDCGPAVVHVMQPAIRQYYNLEEIWGDKPVRLKGPDARAAGAQRKSAAMGEPEAPAKKPAAKKASAKAAPAKKAPAKAPVKAAVAKKAVAKKAPAKKPVAKTAARKSTAALPVQVVNKPKAPAKTAAKSSARPAAKSAGKSAPAKKAVAKKAPAKKAPAKKAASPRASR